MAANQGTKSNNRFVFPLSCVNVSFLLLLLFVNVSRLYDSDLLALCKYVAGKGFDLQSLDNIKIKNPG